MKEDGADAANGKTKEVEFNKTKKGEEGLGD